MNTMPKTFFCHFCSICVEFEDEKDVEAHTKTTEHRNMKLLMLHGIWPGDRKLVNANLGIKWHVGFRPLYEWGNKGGINCTTCSVLTRTTNEFLFHQSSAYHIQILRQSKIYGIPALYCCQNCDFCIVGNANVYENHLSSASHQEKMLQEVEKPKFSIGRDRYSNEVEYDAVIEVGASVPDKKSIGELGDTQKKNLNKVLNRTLGPEFCAEFDNTTGMRMKCKKMVELSNACEVARGAWTAAQKEVQDGSKPKEHAETLKVKFDAVSQKKFVALLVEKMRLAKELGRWSGVQHGFSHIRGIEKRSDTCTEKIIWNAAKIQLRTIQQLDDTTSSDIVEVEVEEPVMTVEQKAPDTPIPDPETKDSKTTKTESSSVPKIKSSKVSRWTALKDPEEESSSSKIAPATPTTTVPPAKVEEIKASSAEDWESYYCMVPSPEHHSSDSKRDSPRTKRRRRTSNSSSPGDGYSDSNVLRWEEERGVLTWPGKDEQDRCGEESPQIQNTDDKEDSHSNDSFRDHKGGSPPDWSAVDAHEEQRYNLAARSDQGSRDKSADDGRKGSSCEEREEAEYDYPEEQCFVYTGEEDDPEEEIHHQPPLSSAQHCEVEGRESSSEALPRVVLEFLELWEYPKFCWVWEGEEPDKRPNHIFDLNDYYNELEEQWIRAGGEDLFHYSLPLENNAMELLKNLEVERNRESLAPKPRRERDEDRRSPITETTDRMDWLEHQFPLPTTSSKEPTTRDTPSPGYYQSYTLDDFKREKTESQFTYQPSAYQQMSGFPSGAADPPKRGTEQREDEDFRGRKERSEGIEAEESGERRGSPVFEGDSPLFPSVLNTGRYAVRGEASGDPGQAEETWIRRHSLFSHAIEKPEPSASLLHKVPTQQRKGERTSWTGFESDLTSSSAATFQRPEQSESPEAAISRLQKAIESVTGSSASSTATFSATSAKYSAAWMEGNREGPSRFPDEAQTGWRGEAEAEDWSDLPPSESSPVGPKLGWCTDLPTLTRREKDLAKGYSTEEYKDYLEKVPKQRRIKGVHPRTPNKSINYSRRSWDAQIRLWRKTLHVWETLARTTTETQEQEGSAQTRNTAIRSSHTLASANKTEKRKLSLPGEYSQGAEPSAMHFSSSVQNPIVCSRIAAETSGPSYTFTPDSSSTSRQTAYLGGGRFMAIGENAEMTQRTENPNTNRWSRSPWSGPPPRAVTPQDPGDDSRDAMRREMESRGFYFFDG